MADKSTFYGWLIKIGIIVIICLFFWIMKVVTNKYPNIFESKVYKMIEKFLILPSLYVLLIIAVIVFVVL